MTRRYLVGFAKHILRQGDPLPLDIHTRLQEYGICPNALEDAVSAQRDYEIKDTGEMYNDGQA